MMTEKRFIFKQDGNFHTVIDTVENKPMGVFEFKENEFPKYACFHMIIDKMNELHEENYKIKSILLKKVEELNNDYDKSTRAGMPTGGIIGELDSFEEICRNMGWIE